jgi:hypothetical protein
MPKALFYAGSDTPGCCQRCYMKLLVGNFLRAVEMEIGGKRLEESIYGWQDIRILLTGETH